MFIILGFFFSWWITKDNFAPPGGPQIPLWEPLGWIVDDWLTYCRLPGENAEKLCFLHDNLKLLRWNYWELTNQLTCFISYTNARTSVAVTNATTGWHKKGHHLNLTNFWNIFCCQVTWTLRTTSFGVAHPLSTDCKGHCTLWSALPGLPSPNMASLDHSGSRTTTSSLWQSTPSDMPRCLANSGQHLVDGEGSSESSSGSSKTLPPPHLKRIIGMATATFPWPTDQLQVWPAVVAAFTGLEPPDFYMWGYLNDRVYGNNPQTIPDLKVAITAAMRTIPREECGRVIENFEIQIQMCLQRRELIWSTFLSASETKSFCSADLKLWRCLLHRLDLV